ncbi:LamG-like jellyroll fold domain-containing protein [Algibacter sp. R77976]|uniref:LamG-like jellyroll fold domain-containing protein n=1 Tax=Algibacter sp. R77976 TaxID=3093873 RepID=UPI0037CA8B26
MEKKSPIQSKILLLFIILIKTSLVFSMSLTSPTKNNENFKKTDKLLLEKANNIVSYFDVNANLTQVEATCANNGSITAIASGATSSPSLYLFKITNGPTANGQTYPFADQFHESTFTFNDLYPGVYQVTIEDAGDSSNPVFVGNITVVDETEVLSFLMNSTSPNCPNENTGSITVNTSAGAGPYQYQIIDGPSGTTTTPIDNVSTTHVFSNLPSGNYRIRVFDACGDFQTRNHTVNNASSSSVNLVSNGINRISCTEAIYSVRVFGFSSGHTYEVVGGAPVGYSSSNTTGDFTLPINQAPYTFSVTGDCGSSDTYTHNNPSAGASFSDGNETCTDFQLQINPNSWMVGPFTYTLTSTPAGYTGPVTNTSGVFDNMPYGNYNYTVTDSCGTVVSGSGTADIEPVQISSSTRVDPDSCNEGMGTAYIFYNSSNAVGPVQFELTTFPAGFTGNAGPKTGNVFDDIVVGNYIVTATDACGNSDTFAFEFREEDALSVEFEINVIQGCINSHSVQVDVTTNSGGFGAKWFRLREAATGNLVGTTASFFGPATFNNVTGGEYYIDYDVFSGCSTSSESFTVEAYGQPQLTPLSSYVCTNNGFVTVSGITEGGVGPFIYSLINNSNNQVLATNTECYFTNQDASLNYRVRIEDNCGNSSSAQVTPIAVGLGLEFQGQTCAPIGDPFSIYLREYTGVSYNWTFPDGSSFNGSDPRATIGIITSSDYGLYTIVASTDDGCRTQTLNLDFNQCPPPSIDFDGIDDYISAPSSFNLSDMEELTIQFWVKANSASQVSAGIVGQRGILEVTKDTSLGYNFNGQGNSGAYSKSEWLDDTDTWQHVSIVYNSGEIKTYYNGHLDYVEPSSGVTRTAISENLFNIGGRTGVVNGSDYFHGWIDEVRVFDKALTETQIQQIVYQEIENNNGNVRGAIIPKDIKDFNTGESLLWSNLKLYYKMGTTFTSEGKVIDYSGNENHGTIFNIRTRQEETAPMPYVTSHDGDWGDSSTWLHGDVWDIASGAVFSNTGSDDFTTSSIVKISHDISLNHNVEGVTQMGLIVDNGNTLTIADDKYIKNVSYLELDGTIDFIGDSQLIQGVNSDLVTSATGKILRRQEGTASPYWYNYWSSPVGTPGATSLIDNNTASNNPNNTSFSLDMLKDESGFDVQFTSGYTGSNSISSYWLYTFKNGKTYWDWEQISTSTALQPGVGYTQKGTGTAASEQQYIFEGKPNNGTILIDVDDVGGTGSLASVSKTDYLLGNPYPSALNIHKFIDDNEGVIKGALQLWQQWSGSSHNLSEYNGGYAQVNKTGTVRASQFVGLEGDDTDGKEGTKIPTKYLPIGQGFIVEIEDDGDLPFSGKVEFNNSQRAFILESDADATDDQVGSVFSKTEKGKKTSSESASKSSTEEVMQKIRLEFNSTSGPATRQELLLGFSEFTTDGYDYGYDAENSAASNNDLNLDLDGKHMNIQAYASITADKVVPLNFSSSGDNAFEISISETNNLEAEQPVYLRDNLTGTYFNLREDTAYGFTSEQGIFNDRFAIVFQSEQQSLSTETSEVTENHVYYQNSTNTLYVKKLNSDVSKLSLVNMRGQTIMEMANVSKEELQNGLQFNNITTGAYVVCMRTETNEVVTKKIIIK